MTATDTDRTPLAAEYAQKAIDRLSVEPWTPEGVKAAIAEAWLDGVNGYVQAATERHADMNVVGMDTFEASVRAHYQAGYRSSLPFGGGIDEEQSEDEYVATLVHAWQHLAMTSHADMFDAMRMTLKFRNIPVIDE